MKVTMCAHHFYAATFAVAKNDVRPHLKGTRLDFQHKCLVATNGHLLAKFLVEVENVGNSVTLAPSSGKWPKPAGKETNATIVYEDGKYLLTYSGHPKKPNRTFLLAPVEGSFPNWERVIPNFDDLGGLGLSPVGLAFDLLQDVAKIAKTLRKKGFAFEITIGDTASPQRWVAGDFQLILMPTRV